MSGRVDAQGFALVTEDGARSPIGPASPPATDRRTSALLCAHRCSRRPRAV